jgi:DNA repair exonuclease SbcCD ATPase subunit
LTKRDSDPDSVVKSLSGAQERLTALVDLAKDAGNDEEKLAKCAEEAKAISALLSPTSTVKAEPPKEEPKPAAKADEKDDAKKAEEKKEDEKPAEAKKAEPAVDPFEMISDALHDVAKAGRRISSGRLNQFKKVAALHKQAGDMMAELMKDLDPAERKVVEDAAKKVAKSAEPKPDPEPEPIAEGNAGRDAPVDTKKSAGGWDAGVDLNA